MLFSKISQAKPYTTFSDLLKLRQQKKLTKVLKRNIEIYLAETKRTLEHFIIDFVYNSNRAEGSKIAKVDFVKIIQEKKTAHANRNEVLEVKNSFKLLDFLNKGFIWNE